MCKDHGCVNVVGTCGVEGFVDAVRMGLPMWMRDHRDGPGIHADALRTSGLDAGFLFLIEIT